MSSGFGVDDKGRATGGQRIRTRAHRHSGVDDGRLRRAIRCNLHIVHVAGVRTGRVLQPVLLARRIEMRAGRLERGRIACGRLVQVNSMFAGREPLEVELECDTRRAIRLERRRPDDRPASISQSDLFRILGNEEYTSCHRDAQRKTQGKTGSIHTHLRHAHLQRASRAKQTGCARPSLITLSGGVTPCELTWRALMTMNGARHATGVSMFSVFGGSGCVSLTRRSACGLLACCDPHPHVDDFDRVGLSRPCAPTCFQVM